MKIIPLISFALLMCSCAAPEAHKIEDVIQNTSSTDTIESFDTFYTKFHTDSAFHMSRIKFPLSGYSDDCGEQTNWTPENWRVFKVPITEIDTNEFKVSRKSLPNEVMEKVWLEDAGFSIEVKYQLIEGKWYLKHYLEISC